MFYINCVTRGNNLLLTYGFENEVRYVKVPNFQPTLFHEARGQDTGYRDLVSGVELMPTQYENIRAANAAIQEARDIEGLTVYGNRNFHYAFLHSNFANMEKSYRPEMIRGFIIDIECPAERGFPCPGKAEWPINLMGIYDTFTKKYRIWGENAHDMNRYAQKLIDEGVDPADVIYYEIKDEVERLTHMVEWWSENHPAYITGWNTSLFDLPYIINRLMKLGINPNALSPWGSVTVREKEFMGKPEFHANILGVADLDYMDLYKKNRFKVRESYRLDFIAHIELGKQKVDYSEVAKNLRTLHKKDWDLYTVYNVMDIALVKQLDEKFGYLAITFAVAYAAGINYDDVSSPVNTWENILYRDTIDKGIVLPPKKNNDKVNYEGGYVKFPQVGKHKWVCSFDLNSLYPHLIMGSNISPETITPLVVPDANVESILEGATTGRRGWTPPNQDVAVCASGNTFRKDRRGIMGYEMERLYSERKAIKKEMLQHEQDVEDIKAGRNIPEFEAKYGIVGNVKALEAEAARQASLKDGGQHVRKILLNSAYGALANVHFCLFDIRLAESITKQGQLSVRWAGDWVNKRLNENLGTNKFDYIVYTDTDSIYVNMAEIVKRAGFNVNERDIPKVKEIVQYLDDYCEETMQGYIDEGYDALAKHCNSYDQKMIMKREVISDNSVFCAKKRYALSVWNSEGVAYDEAYIKTIGLDVVKSSTPEVVRGAMKKTIELMLNGTESDVQKYIKGFKTEFKKQKPEDIAFPRGVSKVEETYLTPAGRSDRAQVRMYKSYTNGTTVPIQSRAAIIYNMAIKEYGLDLPKILPADKIKFIHVELPNKLNTDVVGFPDVLPEEFKLHDKIDHDLQFEKTYLKPMRDILDLIGWSEKPVASLESFFS